ncbi:hypothetical protein DJ010_16380 [Nocardioides silvaticus]|uniref:Uncharacterized protein n=1 Tax=Nocardioides silvaticus TaxID=2201891 RepID=A0A316TBE7_9ACTN|nr:hypothetical protein [Nocardioides silvaticus]PWN01627.1 hypothetical protein DJ010_16380 [Nocardioides silvaticus]
MNPTSRLRTVLATTVVAMGLGLTACSEDPSPAESVPEIEAAPEAVDDAIEAGKARRARDAVEDLIARTAQARVDGDITPDQADDIFDAAQAVLAELPGRDERRGDPASEE